MPPSPSPLSVLSQVKQAGSEMGENIGAIAAKNQSINQYKASTKAPSAASPAPASPARYKLDGEGTGKYGSRPGEQRIDTKDMTKPLGSFKKGGKVKKTGVYKLHAKERVMNAKQTAKMEKMGGVGAVLSGKK